MHRPVPRLRRAFVLLSRDKVAFAALVFIVAILLVSLFAGLIAPQDPNEQSLRERLLPPLSSRDGRMHLLGTDSLGRDLAARLIHGTRLTLLIPVAAAAMA